MQAHRPNGQPPLAPLEQLRQARAIIASESEALARLATRLDGQFCQAVALMFDCSGSVLTCGMGKAGLIAQKITATLASTGTRSHHLHPGEAVHGDLGRVGPDDVVLVLSQSGETEEVVRLLPSLAGFGVPVIAIVGRRSSTLGQAATVSIELGPIVEACPLGLAPSTSTTAMLAIGDALALVTSQMRGFQRDDFARFHPAGNLGRQLSRVDDSMRPLHECRVALQSLTVREVLVEHSRSGRRSGAMMLVDGAGRLTGVFTDSDLARLFEHKRDQALDRPIREVMSTHPLSVAEGSLMADSVAIMAGRKISELPVLDLSGRPVGLIDITDVVGLYPEAQEAIFGPAAEPRLAPTEQAIPPRECA
jgi:arabinose-5-phosphate isomerase